MNALARPRRASALRHRLCGGVAGVENDAGGPVEKRGADARRLAIRPKSLRRSPVLRPGGFPFGSVRDIQRPLPIPNFGSAHRTHHPLERALSQNQTFPPLLIAAISAR